MQHMVDYNLTHSFSERLSMSVGVPLVAASWGSQARPRRDDVHPMVRRTRQSRCGGAGWGSSRGLPIGVQVVGRLFEEELMLSVAADIERASGGYRRPSIVQD